MWCVGQTNFRLQCAPMLAKRIGQNIKAARLAKNGGKGWSLEKLAARVNPPTSYQQLARLESAARPITIDWIERIAKALDVDPVSLVVADRAAEPRGFHLDEQVAAEVAQTLASVALQGEEPEPGTVEALALILQELTATFSKHPEAAADARVARPVVDQAARRYVPVAS